MKQVIRTAIAFCAGFTMIVMLLSSAAAQSSADLYKSKCAACHAPDGTGNTPVGTKLGVKAFKGSKSSDAEMFNITKKGKGKMPAYENKLTDDQIKDLVKYIRGPGKGK